MHDLDRFVAAQAAIYPQALDELHRGRKTSHWMWFVFPQIAGLGHSATARHYALADLAEAQAYLAHPLLGPRLTECTRALLEHAGIAAEAILGGIDATKLRSSMTLFEAAQGERGDDLFARCLDAFHGGVRDPATLALLGAARRNWREGPQSRRRSDVTALLALIASAAAMTVIVGVRYLLTSGGFAWATRLRHPGLYTGLDRQMRREIAWSLFSAAIYGVPAGIIAWGWKQHGWTRIYEDVHAFPLWYVPVSVLLFMFAHDTWFYWTHRWMHRPGPFKLAHAVHHASRPPTAWAAMAFHPIEALTGAVVIPLLVFVIPIHIGALGLVLAIMTLMGVTNHMGWEMFPRWMWTGRLGGWLITASHHQRHHAEYRCNYGLYFRFWDRLCGTDRGLGTFGRARGARTGNAAGGDRGFRTDG